MCRNIVFKFFTAVCIFNIIASNENCQKTHLLSACVLWCKSLGLPVNSEKTDKKCCCKLNDDVSKHYKIIQGDIFSYLEPFLITNRQR